MFSLNQYTLPPKLALQQAIAKQQAGQLQEARQLYQNILQGHPGYADAHLNLLSLFHMSGQFADMEQQARKMIEHLPKSGSAWMALGVSLLNQGKEALHELKMATKYLPDYAGAHDNLGVAQKRARQFDEAVLSFRRAIKFQPKMASAHANLADCLRELGQIEEALSSCQSALSIQPDLAEAYCILGNILRNFARNEEAEKAYRRALELVPGNANFEYCLATLLLAQGRFADAWGLHEARYAQGIKVARAEVPALAFPQWRGESLEGKSVLLYPEQGFGDYIQFVRYAPLLKDRGASRITLACAPPLKPLLETALGVDAVIADGEAIGQHDYWSFPMSLPLHCTTTLDTIPATIPYLHALPESLAHWRTYLPANGIRVGLVWKGSAKHANDANRSLPGLAALAPLWNNAGVHFISLQKGQDEDAAEQLAAQQPILDLGTKIKDFSDTAAIVAQLDLVITVDTAIAHVAGALGKPCWVLLPACNADWRWLLGRTDTPWYPDSMRLFRQSKLNDWSETLKEVAAALENWMRLAVLC